MGPVPVFDPGSRAHDSIRRAPEFRLHRCARSVRGARVVWQCGPWCDEGVVETVLLSDPRVATIPVSTDVDEAILSDGVGVPGLVIDPRKADAAGCWSKIRPEIFEMLQTAAEHASRNGLTLRLVEGYRPGFLQARYFEEYLESLRAEDPNRSETELRSLAARHVSPPEIAPHTAGAAVDVTLERDGVELDLGCPVNATPECSNGLCFTDHPGVTGAAAENRRALIDIMTTAGFVNYPTEWWHWSYGDRYWAWATASHEALFGPI